MLLEMTPHWADITNSLSSYVVKKKEKNILFKEPLDEYNEWLHWSGLHPEDAELAQWCIGFLRALIQSDIRDIQDALLLDKVKIPQKKI